MNNIKKIGLTALAGSLVTLGSAQAGEMSVSGGINTALKFGKGGGNTSRTIGTDKDVAFTGGGESSHNTSNTSIYVNAVSQSIQNTGSTGTSGNDSYIGTRQGFAASNFLDGSMALIRYYDKALTESEIKQNFQANKGRFGL